MDIYKVNRIGALLAENTYPGRGIVAGLSEDGTKAVFAYFIMGRSENSRNRIFIEEGADVKILPFDESKVEDPSLIIYYPVRTLGSQVIVTNGDQTDTVWEYLKKGEGFETALKTRTFEPDGPNWTPRISGLLNLDGAFGYKLSILKSADAAGTRCNRFTYDYEPVAGLGHFIHTYRCDGNPIPTFTADPERVAIPDSSEEFAREIWSNLNEANKVSMYVRYIDLATGETTAHMVNKHQQEAEYDERI